MSVSGPPGQARRVGVDPGIILDPEASTATRHFTSIGTGCSTMADVRVRTPVELDEPTMVEGLPGVGLVGKIATDHLIASLDMVHHANLHCDSIPPVAMYEEDAGELQTPVRLYAAPEEDLLALRSDVPVSPAAARAFADCLDEHLDGNAAFPVYLSGIPREAVDEVPSLYGVGVSEGVDRVADAGIDEPTEAGIVSGPTGALLNHAIESESSAAGLVVETDPRFPDPGSARVLIKQGIEPLAGIEVSVENLVERADEIQDARERLAKRMQEADEESTQAQPLRMYQ